MKEKTNAGVHTTLHIAFETQCLADARDGGGLSAFKRELQAPGYFQSKVVVFPLSWLYFKNTAGFLNSSHGIYFDAAIGCRMSAALPLRFL